MWHDELDDACGQGHAWAEQFDSLEEAWLRCERGDWMLWWLERVCPNDRRLYEIGCDCAERALRFVPVGEERPRLAIEARRSWLRGEVSDEELAKAADAAYSAYAAAAAADAAANAAAYGADERKAQADIVRKYFPTLPRRGEEA